jgi:bifunctional DNA-binding transcriptional regulator/antitoxin component of YhaV-PrlF toxin-antitoxin module
MSENHPGYSSARRLAKPVAMSAGGRLTLPAEAREELGIKGETQFQVEVIPGGLVLREAITVPSEDAWAYTPEYRAQVERSRRDHAEGRVRTLSVKELERLAGVDPGQE